MLRYCKITVRQKVEDVSRPDFICMGFQKCGTTTLFEILNQHPQVALCRDVKEPMYYRVPVASFIGRGRFYRWRYFGHIEEGDPRLVGEVNAGLTFTHCARKLARDLDHDTKMIFMMRNPVDRSYSAYKYFLARGFLPNEAVEADARMGHAQGFDAYVHGVLDDPRRRGKIMDKRLKYLVLSQSNYATCIEEYLDCGFSRENMKFVLFEDFVRDQHAACLDLYGFLGLEEFEGINYAVRANEGKRRAVSGPKAERAKVIKGWKYFFHEFACMQRWAPNLYQRYADFCARYRAGAIVEDMAPEQKVLPETRAFLMEYFKDEIARVQQITGLNVRKAWGIE